jgi:hypothetical protein
MQISVDCLRPRRAIRLVIRGGSAKESAVAVRPTRSWFPWIIVGCIGVAALVCSLEPTRSNLLRFFASVGAFDSDARAKLLVMSARAGDEESVKRICETMLAESEETFSLVVLEYLWEAQNPSAHRVMRAWLDDPAVAWPDDPRQIRRCDLAAYYFRTYVGEGRWDTAKSLARDIADRESFRATVVAHIDDHGLPARP